MLRVASCNLHFGEEPPISGTNGSGAIFLSGCSLRCSYCQNYPISQLGVGRDISAAGLSGEMLRLEEAGAHNINFVTPTHHTPELLAAILMARRHGLTIPIVWNTSGYERVETLRLLEGIVDIYLADMRYAEPAAGRRYSRVKDYPEINRLAVMEMHRQVGPLQLDDRGVARRGLLLRHLVLPGGIAGSRAVFSFIARMVSPETKVSVMSQYFPAYEAVDHPLLGRRITGAEYEAALEAFFESGLEQGYTQDWCEDGTPSL
jgi:putative pyruvate formate lyase activating enzyme